MIPDARVYSMIVEHDQVLGIIEQIDESMHVLLNQFLIE